MIGGLDPRKMQALMKQMGIKSEEIKANRVVIECDGYSIIVENPQVIKVAMQGTESFQVSGVIKKESVISEDDVALVAEKANVSKEEAKKALEECNGDIAEAILKLSQ